MKQRTKISEVLDDLFLKEGDRVHTRDLENHVVRRGTYRGTGADGWARVAWDGDRTISHTSRADLRKGDGQ